MVKVVVDNIIDKYNYILKDISNKIYKLNIEFLDIDIDLGDTIYLDESILKENNIYTFGKINNNNLDIKDYIKVVTRDKEYILERCYG